LSASTRHVVSNRYDISREIRYDQSPPTRAAKSSVAVAVHGLCSNRGAVRAVQQQSPDLVIESSSTRAIEQTQGLHTAPAADGRQAQAVYAYIFDPGARPGRNRRAEIYAELDILVNNASLIAHQTLDGWTPARSIQSSGQRARPACGHTTKFATHGRVCAVARRLAPPTLPRSHETRGTSSSPPAPAVTSPPSRRRSEAVAAASRPVRRRCRSLIRMRTPFIRSGSSRVIPKPSTP
jgi:hypothetical protein